MPRLFRVLRKASLAGGCKDCAKVHSSFRKSTDSFRRSSSRQSDDTFENTSGKIVLSSWGRFY
jgi:hypothetical protein